MKDKLIKRLFLLFAVVIIIAAIVFVLDIGFEKGYEFVITKTSNAIQKDENKKYIHRERISVTNCSREFYVGEVDEEMINASFKDGILTISMPIKEKEATKKIINID